MSKQTSQVFFDPTRKRWKYAKIILSLALIYFISISTSVVLGILNSSNNSIEKYPAKSYKSVKPEPWIPNNQKLTYNNRLAISSNTKPIPNKKIIGFFVNWDANSFISLKKNIQNIDVIIPEWLYYSDNGLALNDENKQKQVLQYLKDNNFQKEIIVSVNNYDNGWNSQAVETMLIDNATKDKFTNDLIDYVNKNNLDGINLDLEFQNEKYIESYLSLINTLSQKLHQNNKKLYLTSALEETIYDDIKTINNVDYFLLMAYDEHSLANDPGPIAAQGWFLNNVNTKIKKFGSEKTIIILGNYGYDWNEETKTNSSITFWQAMNLANNSQARIQFDKASYNPTFNYYDDQDQLHKVWYLDAATAYNQMIKTTNAVSGYGLWRLGSEDSAIWNLVGPQLNNNILIYQSLETIPNDYAITREGLGEIIEVRGNYQKGSRTITYNKKEQLIENEIINQLPQSPKISRYPVQDKKKIALTFDDGPDSRNTPQILEILKQKNVKATFFIIGMNASLNPNLVKQIVADGHEIGNHTFTHADIVKTSDFNFKIELNSTQKVLESLVGKKTILFRPPYLVEEPQRPQEIGSLAKINNYGFYTIWADVDSYDWKTTDSDEIYENVISQVQEGKGNIVLFHDGGGSRVSTIEALPKIIDGLQSQGYQLVSTSEIINLPNAKVMPSVENNFINQKVSKFGISNIFYFKSFLTVIFIVGIILTIFRFMVVNILAIFHKRLKKPKFKQKLPSLSVLIPIHNEEKVILKTINSVLKSRYPRFKIIIVDDGSDDRSFELVQKKYGLNQKVKIYKLSHRGKSNALNFGVNRIRSEIIVTMDADTRVQPSSLLKIAEPFFNPRIGAVAGYIQVANLNNILTNLQAVEYIIGQNLEKRAFSLLNCISVVPGAFGAWRRNAIIEAGGYSDNTNAEDSDLTIAILNLGYKVVFEAKALAYTIAPETLPAFIKQRFRWTFGTIQVAWKYRNILLDSKKNLPVTIAILNTFVYQFIYSFLAPIVDIIIIFSLIFIIQQLLIRSQFAFLSLYVFLSSYLIFLGIDFLTALIAFSMEKKFNKKLFIYVLLQRVMYRQLLYFVSFKTFIAALRGGFVKWEKTLRIKNIFTKTKTAN